MKHILFLLTLSLGCWLLPAEAADNAALTDDAGNFTWPPKLGAWQITDYTNHDLKIWNTNVTGLTVDLQQDGGFQFHNGSMNMFLQGGTNFGVQDSAGGFGYSNGVFWVNANLFYQAIVAQINTNPAIATSFAFTTNFTVALNALSNRLYSAISDTNATLLSALNGTNATLFGALLSTNLITSNSLAQLINTNGINSTNLAYLLAQFGTNYAYFLSTNNGSQFTNWLAANSNSLNTLIYGIGNNLTNLFTSTNQIAAHFRFGQFSTINSNQNTVVTFTPPFNDPNFIPFITISNTLQVGGLPGVLMLGVSPQSFNSFNFLQDTNAQFNSPNLSYWNYILYHP